MRKKRIAFGIELSPRVYVRTKSVAVLRIYHSKESRIEKVFPFTDEMSALKAIEEATTYSKKQWDHHILKQEAKQRASDKYADDTRVVMYCDSNTWICEFTFNRKTMTIDFSEKLYGKYRSKRLCTDLRWVVLIFLDSSLSRRRHGLKRIKAFCEFKSIHGNESTNYSSPDMITGQIKRLKYTATRCINKDTEEREAEIEMLCNLFKAS